MRSGGGKQKGNLWEREVGRYLSKWLTDGQRTNVFARNVLSGGGFTITEGKGRETPNIPGDLMAASPLAFEFLSLFSIECKNTEAIDLAAFMYDKRGKSFLAITIAHTARQAKLHGLTWMIVAKQNRHVPFVLMDYTIGRQAIAASPFPTAIRFHSFFSDAYMLITLDHLTRLTNARRFLATVKAWQQGNAYTIVTRKGAL